MECKENFSTLKIAPEERAKNEQKEKAGPGLPCVTMTPHICFYIMNFLKKPLFRTFFAFIVLFLTAGICSALELKTDNYTITTEAVSSPGFALVSIKSDVSDTLIQIDNVPIGMSPWSGKLTPGNHVINLSAPDHYNLQFLLTCQENTKYTISCTLDPFTGFLDITISPEDAELYLDGAKITDHFREVPVGYHTISARKFGFDEKSLKVLVLRGKVSRVALVLASSSFSVRDFRLSRILFNPGNRGLFGTTTLAFTVTAPGYGRIEIRDSAGNLIFQYTLLLFTTWAQSFSWNGETETGPAPDGTYTARLLLWPEKKPELSAVQSGQAAQSAQASAASSAQSPLTPGELKQIESSEQASIVQEISFRIDRSQIIAPAGYENARTGLAFISSPSMQELPVFGLDIGGIIGYGAASASAGVGLSGGIRLGSSAALGFAGSFFGNGDAGLSASLNGAVLKSPNWDAAVSARYEIADFSNSGGIISNNLELTIPLALKTGAVRFGLEPGIRLNLDDASIAPQTGAGLWYRSPSLFAGFSAQQVFAPGGIASDTNPLSLAIDAKYMLNRVPLTLGLRLSAAMTPELARLQAFLGMGFAF